MRPTRKTPAAPEHAPVRLPRRVEPARPPADDRRGREHGERERAEEEGEAARLLERREHQAAVRDREDPEDVAVLVERRQAQQDPGPPEDDDDEHRDVAKRLHVERGRPPHEPVRREPRHAHDHAEDRGEQDAEEGDLRRVPGRDEERLEDVLARAEVRVGDREPGRLAQVAEVGPDPEPLEVPGQVAPEVEQEEDDQEEEDALERPAKHADVPPERRPRPDGRRRWSSRRSCCVRSAGRRLAPPPRTGSS